MEKKVLHRGGILLEIVVHNKCLKSFVDFVQESSNVRDIQSSSMNTVLIGHNSNSFDTLLLLRTILHYYPELIQKMNDLKIHFADSLVLFRHLIKEKHEALKTFDGSFTDINQAALYGQLFKAEFEGHDALEDVKALKKILFHSPTGTTSAEIINKSNTTTPSSAIADMSYLDKSHNLLKSFDRVIEDKSHPGIFKRSLAKKLADSGLSYKDLQQLW